MEGETHYTTLGVEIDSTQEEIKRAYKKLALKFHPDKSNDDDEKNTNEVIFKKITAAYGVLSDEDQRQQYDYELSNASYSDQNMAYRYNRSSDTTVKLNVKTSELYNGKIIRFQIKRKILCETCDGYGWRLKKNGKPYVPPTIDCRKCEGSGYIQVRRPLAPGFVTTDNVQCPNCGGTGQIHKTPGMAKNSCHTCHGKCLVDVAENLDIIVPRGSNNGDVVKFKNKADQGLHVRNPRNIGDLIFVFEEELEPEKNLERYGNNLITRLSIPLADAIAGFKDKLVVKTFDGRDLTLTIPTGKVIRPNDIIKITNEGWPLNQRASAFGDLYVMIEIEFPPDNWISEKSDVTKIKNILPTSLSTKIHGEDPNNTEQLVEFEFIKELPKLETPNHDEEQFFNGASCNTQ